MKKITFLILFTLSFSLFTYLSTAQIVTTIAGNGVAGYSGDGLPAISAELDLPSGVAVDNKNNIYIADSPNNRIRKIDNRGVITTYAGNGIPGYYGDRGAATAAQINNPHGLTVDSAGNLYIADGNNNRIRKVDTFGIITTVAGNGVAGFSGDGRPASAAELRTPTEVTLDKQGNLYISDGGNFRIREINTSGTINTIAGNGVAGFSGDGGLAVNAEFNSCIDVFVDIWYNIFIADKENNRVRVINTSGKINTFAGNGVASYSGDGGPPTAAELNTVTGVRRDTHGNVYIADWGNNRMRVVDSAGSKIKTIAGNGIRGYTGDGGEASVAECFNPGMMTLSGGIHSGDNESLIFLDHSNNVIRKLYLSLSVWDSVLTNVTCPGTATGSAIAAASYGMPPYTYSWRPCGITDSTATGLSAGIYTVTVKDHDGITGSATATITQPSKPALGVTIARAKNVGCSGGFDGMALALGSGGIPPYSYYWPPGGAITSLITGLSAGTYSVTVTDAMGCSATAVSNITQPSVLTVTDTTIASLTLAIPSGGTPPYSYTWLPGGSTSSMTSGISAGTYTIIITDANSCQDSAVVRIKQPLSAGLNLSLQYLVSSCDNLPSAWADFGIYATSLPNTVFHNCVVDIHYSNSEFYPDSNSGNIEVYPGPNFMFLYDYTRVIHLSDSVMEIQFGDSTESAAVAAGEIILNDTAQLLLEFQLQVQSPCQSGTVSFTNTLTTMTESNYTDSMFVGSSYVYSDSAYTTVYTNSPQTSPACGGSAISITDFNDTTHAGIGETLTIDGSGFGGYRGTGQVKFMNADSANYRIQKLNTTDYINWADNQIQIRLPAFADSTGTSNVKALMTIGGGNFMVVNSCGDSMMSATNLHSDTFSVLYNIRQLWNLYSNQKAEILLRKEDDSGGYVFRFDSISFPRNSYRRKLFQKAMRDWICHTGVNWRVGKDTTYTYIPGNFTPKLNYVFFTDSLLGNNILAQTDPNPYQCSDSVNILVNAVMYFNADSTRFKFVYDSTGTVTISSGKADFYGVCLHELGHFIQLNHTSTKTDLMYYTANNGPLSPTFRADLSKRIDTAADLAGVYSVNQSVSISSGTCRSLSAMVPSRDAFCMNPTGIREVHQNNSFFIYPNPSNGTFIIESPINDYTLVVSNMLGQRLFSKKIEEKKAEINLSMVANGMYFIQEQYDKGIATQKLIITKNK